jgi:vancomycin resistance protein VanW
MHADRRDPLLPMKIAAHRALRYARWAVEAAGYARRRPARPGEYVLAEHRSRLVRDPARAALEMAAGKIENLRLAAAALDGVTVLPGEVVSFWYLVGAPEASRGFQRGMELRSGCVVPSVGGGICQIAGALFEVALRAGFRILEHHPHSLELAPEPDRIRPFGSAAAVLYPYRDVRAKNEGDAPATLYARVEEEALVVGLTAATRPRFSVSLEERGYRAAREGGTLYREGELWRAWRDAASGEPLSEERVLALKVAVMEEMPEHHCYTCDRACPNSIPASDPEASAARAEAGAARGRKLPILV